MASNSVCSIDGCGKPNKARGWCSAHHAKWSKYGDPLTVIRKPTAYAPCCVESCKRTGSTARKGMCAAHYKRLHRYGDPAGGSDFRAPRGLPRQWLVDHAGHIGADCLKWPFAGRGNGYGAVTDERGRLVGAHAEMCRLSHGEKPSPKHQALHSCGKGDKGCVHPAHLRWGTQLENMHDKYDHGTMSRPKRVRNR